MIAETAKARPDEARIAFTAAATGLRIEREGRIEWLTDSVGAASVPALDLGKRLFVLCVWDGAALSALACATPESLTFGLAVANLAREVAALRAGRG